MKIPALYRSTFTLTPTDRPGEWHIHPNRRRLRRAVEGAIRSVCGSGSVPARLAGHLSAPRLTVTAGGLRRVPGVSRPGKVWGK